MTLSDWMLLQLERKILFGGVDTMADYVTHKRKRCPICYAESGTVNYMQEHAAGTFICSTHGVTIDVDRALSIQKSILETPIVDGKPKKFYAGAKHIGHAIERGKNATCTRDTFEEAVKDAQDYMQKDDSLNTVVVVQIVAVVRRQKPAIDVEKFVVEEKVVE